MGSHHAPEPDTVAHSRTLIAIATGTITLLASLSVILRLASRILNRLGVRWDDWACVGALVFAYGYLATTIVAAVLAADRLLYQPWEHGFSHIAFYLQQLILPNSILYNTSVSLCKISILLFYTRIFSTSRPLQMTVYIVAAFIAAYWISVICGSIFMTDPIEAQWKMWISHRRINTFRFYLTMGVANTVLDLVVLVIPQPLVCGLQMGRRQRVSVSFVFALGGFVCIASIVRIYFIATMNMSDAHYTHTNATLWTMIEMNTGIICTCLPMLPGFVQYFHRRYFARKSSTAATEGALVSRDMTYSPLPHHVEEGSSVREA
ncbi:uncharacterized protein DSM5745_00818 [Aspergillus mulundensis]|uniref:Rhodopsin domain-containing protein n=1 Tax=Aspergillus mulundensis TaxID=1810919 RepID=A0A3D8T4L6_9EURO|nr:hypothetical protein DSM5745_00818 [Aspergillus mulundensis]RDW93496.1 hypothetical protein DSM5745_00818 [Aspergillus mulundensis]